MWGRVGRVGQEVLEVVLDNECEEYAAQSSNSLDRDTHTAVRLSLVSSYTSIPGDI